MDHTSSPQKKGENDENSFMLYSPAQSTRSAKKRRETLDILQDATNRQSNRLSDASSLFSFQGKSPGTRRETIDQLDLQNLMNALDDSTVEEVANRRATVESLEDIENLLNSTNGSFLTDSESPLKEEEEENEMEEENNNIVESTPERPSYVSPPISSRTRSSGKKSRSHKKEGVVSEDTETTQTVLSTLTSTPLREEEKEEEEEQDDITSLTSLSSLSSLTEGSSTNNRRDTIDKGDLSALKALLFSPSVSSEQGEEESLMDVSEGSHSFVEREHIHHFSMLDQSSCDEDHEEDEDEDHEEDEEDQEEEDEAPSHYSLPSESSFNQEEREENRRETCDVNDFMNFVQSTMDQEEEEQEEEEQERHDINLSKSSIDDQEMEEDRRATVSPSALANLMDELNNSSDTDGSDADEEDQEEDQEEESNTSSFLRRSPRLRKQQQEPEPIAMSSPSPKHQGLNTNNTSSIGFKSQVIPSSMKKPRQQQTSFIQGTEEDQGEENVSLQERSVVFGSPQACEFSKYSPTSSFTPLSKGVVKKMYSMQPLDERYDDEEGSERQQQGSNQDEVTSRHDQILATWDEMSGGESDSNDSLDASSVSSHQADLSMTSPQTTTGSEKGKKWWQKSKNQSSKCKGNNRRRSSFGLASNTSSALYDDDEEDQDPLFDGMQDEDEFSLRLSTSSHPSSPQSPTTDQEDSYDLDLDNDNTTVYDTHALNVLKKQTMEDDEEEEEEEDHTVELEANLGDILQQQQQDEEEDHDEQDGEEDHTVQLEGGLKDMLTLVSGTDGEEGEGSFSEKSTATSLSTSEQSSCFSPSYRFSDASTRFSTVSSLPSSASTSTLETSFEEEEGEEEEDPTEQEHSRLTNQTSSFVMEDDEDSLEESHEENRKDVSRNESVLSKKTNMSSLDDSSVELSFLSHISDEQEEQHEQQTPSPVDLREEDIITSSDVEEEELNEHIFGENNNQASDNNTSKTVNGNNRSMFGPQTLLTAQQQRRKSSISHVRQSLLLNQSQQQNQQQQNQLLSRLKTMKRMSIAKKRRESAVPQDYQHLMPTTAVISQEEQEQEHLAVEDGRVTPELTSHKRRREEKEEIADGDKQQKVEDDDSPLKKNRTEEEEEEEEEEESTSLPSADDIMISLTQATNDMASLLPAFESLLIHSTSSFYEEDADDLSSSSKKENETQSVVSDDHLVAKDIRESVREVVSGAIDEMYRGSSSSSSFNRSGSSMNMSKNSSQASIYLDDNMVGLSNVQESNEHRLERLLAEASSGNQEMESRLTALSSFLRERQDKAGMQTTEHEEQNEVVASCLTAARKRFHQFEANLLEFVTENVTELSSSLADSIASHEQAMDRLETIQASMSEKNQRDMLYESIQKNSEVIQELKHTLKEKRSQYDSLYLERTKNFFLPTNEKEAENVNEEERNKKLSPSSSQESKLSDEEWKLQSAIMERKEDELEESQQEAQDLLTINNRLHCFRVKKASVRRGVELMVDVASGLSIVVSCLIQEGMVRSIQANLSSDSTYMNTIANLRKGEQQQKELLLSLSEAIAQPLIVDRYFTPLTSQEVTIETFRQVLKATSHVILSLRRVQEQIRQWTGDLISTKEGVSQLERIEVSLSSDSPFVLDLVYQPPSHQRGSDANDTSEHMLQLPLRIILESGGEELIRHFTSFF